MKAPICFLCPAVPLVHSHWARSEGPPKPVAALIWQLGSNDARTRDRVQAKLRDLGIPTCGTAKLSPSADLLRLLREGEPLRLTIRREGRLTTLRTAD